MRPRELKPDIFCVGAVDWDRRLFDELIPLPDGTSYNAYLVAGGARTALLDTVDPTKAQVLLENLQRLGNPRVDYLICHHAEQDHAGAIPRVLEAYPQAMVVCTAKCGQMLMDLALAPADRITAVQDRQLLDLGGRTLEFIEAPWVHWPETMLTYLREERILFPCDLFGSHLATSDLFVTDEALVLEAAKRYYAEIMMPFRKLIRRHLETLSGYEVELIAPSHGPVHRRAGLIRDAYREWVSDRVKNEVVLAYVSMHGSTRAMADWLTEALTGLEVTVRRFDLARTDIGKLAMALVDAATVVIGTPTVLGGPHPLAAYAATLAGALRPKTKFASFIGSYGWGGRTAEKLQGLLSDLSLELLEPVIVKGFPQPEDFASLDRLAGEIARRHRQLEESGGPAGTV